MGTGVVMRLASVERMQMNYGLNSGMLGGELAIGRLLEKQPANPTQGCAGIFQSAQVIEKWRKLTTAFSVFVLKTPMDGLFQQTVKVRPD
jgi:hypothetical protein